MSKMGQEVIRQTGNVYDKKEVRYTVILGVIWIISFSMVILPTTSDGGLWAIAIITSCAGIFPLIRWITRELRDAKKVLEKNSGKE